LAEEARAKFHADVLEAGLRIFWCKESAMSTPVVVEICVDSVESARAAQAGGAVRVELCSGLRAGGITPSAGLIASVRRQISIALHVLIRPRTGDFVYSADELEVMKRDILLARQLGADGAVLGVLDAAGSVDVAHTSELVERARPMEVTFHRAFDATPDLLQGLDAVKQTGAARILTAGGEAAGEERITRIARLVERVGNGVTIMAGGGLRESNVGAILRATNVREVHTSLQPAAPALPRKRFPSVSTGRGDLITQVLNPADVERFVQATLSS